MARQDLQHSTARTLAAVLGTIPVAFAIGALLALVSPGSASLRVTVGLYAIVPLWMALMTVTFLAGSGRRAWAFVLLATAATAGFVAIALALGRAITSTGASS